VLETFPISGNQEIVDPAGNPTGLGPILIDGYALPSHVNATSFRADHIFSPRFSGFFRFGDTPSYSQTRQLYSLSANQVRTRTYTLGFTRQISTAMSNELRVGYDSNNSSVSTITQGFYTQYSQIPDLNTAIGIPNSSNPVSADVYIRVAGAGDTRSSTDQASRSLHQWNIRDTFSLAAGNHLLNFGIDQLHLASTLNPPALSVQADFFDRASLANDLASHVVITRSQPAAPILNEFSAFAEDVWKVSSSVNVNLGLRWEVNPAPTGRNGKDAYTALGDINEPATLSLAPRGTRLWHTTWYNFAPRLGAAWVADATPDKQLVVRLGGGVFFDTGTQPALAAFNGIGFASSDHFQDTPLPVTQPQLDVATTVAPPYSNAMAFAFPSHLQLPYSFQWNVSLEKSLGRDQVVTISYVGASGHRLLQEQRRNVNQLNSNFGDVSYFPGGLTSNYQSLQAKFQRSISHGFQALASYTWAHLLDYGSTDPAFPLAYGNSDLDVRQNLEGAISWDLPKPRENILVRGLLGDWMGGCSREVPSRSTSPVICFLIPSLEALTTAEWTSFQVGPCTCTAQIYPEGACSMAAPTRPMVLFICQKV